MFFLLLKYQSKNQYHVCCTYYHLFREIVEHTLGITAGCTFKEQYAITAISNFNILGKERDKSDRFMRSLRILHKTLPDFY